ncbi:MAG: histidine phosphatase family protein [Alphaproteobacteria bacterium]|nr:histidine phosphatase family protein [Alphaproteobacteria bacterium]
MPLSLPAGLTLYFCRHGETEANVQKRFQGRTRDTPLTSKGREQARSIAHVLVAQASDIAALSYVSSPLPRACTTMEIVLTELKLPQNRFTTDPRLQEIDLGIWDGLTDAEARALDPAMFERRSHDKWDVRVPGGENYADVAARAESWVADLTADTFAVSHGAFTRILRGLFNGLGWKQMSDLEETQGVLFRAQGSTVVQVSSPN